MFENWVQQSIDLKGSRFHYYRLGGGPGKPQLVLAHGFSDNGLCWQPVAEKLEQDFELILPDARGHGASARVTPGENIDAAADLAELIGALDLHQPIVAGHSMGAMVAAQLGARFPSLVRALILEDPAWFLSGSSETPLHGITADDPIGKWVLDLQKKTLEQVMDECRVEHPGWPEVIVRRWCEGKKQLDVNFLYTNRNLPGGWMETVKSVSCPALLVTADPLEGGLVTPEVAATITQANPHFQLAHIPGVGHHIHFGKHKAFMQAVEAFLQDL